METNFTVSVTKPQLTELCKRQTRKATKILFVGAITLLCVIVLLLVLRFAFGRKYPGFIEVCSFIDLFAWVMVILIRCAAPKNAETFFKFYGVDGAVTYDYELREDEFIVTQPAIGNVSHYKYDILQKVNEHGNYVAVMLLSNQFLPIILNEHTAPLVAALKSRVPAAKK